MSQILTLLLISQGGLQENNVGRSNSERGASHKCAIDVQSGW